MERLWPRGVTRNAARLTRWLVDLAPSPALRQWFGHDPKKWSEFQRRYAAELRRPEVEPLLRDLGARAQQETVTFVFAARDPERSNAAVLKHFLERHYLKGKR